MTTASKRGRKPKGRRIQISAKVPADQKPLLEEAARVAGMPLCDYVAVVLAKHHGYEMPTYLDSHRGQEELPLGA